MTEKMWTTSKGRTVLRRSTETLVCSFQKLTTTAISVATAISSVTSVLSITSVSSYHIHHTYHNHHSCLNCHIHLSVTSEGHSYGIYCFMIEKWHRELKCMYIQLEVV